MCSIGLPCCNNSHETVTPDSNIAKRLWSKQGAKKWNTDICSFTCVNRQKSSTQCINYQVIFVYINLHVTNVMVDNELFLHLDSSRLSTDLWYKATNTKNVIFQAICRSDCRICSLISRHYRFISHSSTSALLRGQSVSQFLVTLYDAFCILLNA